MGKAEGSGENWHGHVTAVTCSPQHRRLGLAASLMASLEEISEKKRCYFVDLFVRVSNQVAITMYKNLGYTVYRTVLQYYRYKKKNQMIPSWFSITNLAFRDDFLKVIILSIFLLVVHLGIVSITAIPQKTLF